MSNDLLMRIKDQALLVLADYSTCKTDHSWEWEAQAPKSAAEIAKRMIDNYKTLTGRKKDEQFMARAQTKIEVVVLYAARAKHDPWAICRTEGDRIRAAYEIARAIEDAAGAAHKFSVWSGSILGVTGHGNRGVPCIVAAPSAKAAVEYLNAAVPHARETLSWFKEHWSGGGNTGNKLATKPGVWLGKKKGNTDVVGDYKLIWEPK